MAQSKCQCSAKILLLAAVTLVCMHNLPNSPTCCWTMSQIPKARVAGELAVPVCMDMDYGCWGQYSPAMRIVDEYTRGLWRMCWVTACRPCYCRKLHVTPSINSLGRWYSIPPASLFPSRLFSLNSFFYCTTSVPTDTHLVHHFITEQLHQDAVARIPFFLSESYMTL